MKSFVGGGSSLRTVCVGNVLGWLTRLSNPVHHRVNINRQTQSDSYSGSRDMESHTEITVCSLLAWMCKCPASRVVLIFWYHAVVICWIHRHLWHFRVSHVSTTNRWVVDECGSREQEISTQRIFHFELQLTYIFLENWRLPQSQSMREGDSSAITKLFYIQNKLDIYWYSLRCCMCGFAPVLSH